MFATPFVSSIVRPFSLGLAMPSNSSLWQFASSVHFSTSLDELSASSETSTPYTLVPSELPGIVCDRIIFKRVNQNVAKEVFTHMDLSPLEDWERSAPPGEGTPERQEWEVRLLVTPLDPGELAVLPPEGTLERALWEARRQRTPLSEDELKDEPPYGSPGRQSWRERYQLESGEDNYGHWWVEVYDTAKEYSQATLQASWGWWPEEQVDLRNTILGVTGILNRGQPFDPHALKDPEEREIDWMVDEAFHPMYDRPQSVLIKCLTAFAKGYDALIPPKRWAFPAVGFGRSNCQVFQEEMMKHCGIAGTQKVPVDLSRVKR